MIDTDRQLPAPSASAWAIGLAGSGASTFIVRQRDEAETRAALVAHLVEIGSISNRIEAEPTVAVAPIESVGVVW